MKRRLVFGLVMLALVVNLAMGAKVYLNAAKPVSDDDSIQANMELFNDALQKIRLAGTDGDVLGQDDSQARPHLRVAAHDPSSGMRWMCSPRSRREIGPPS